MISVIVPIYNAAPFLSRCLESLIAQSEQNWEAILVNDGSTDESGDICQHYAATDNRFHYHCQPNGGVSSARNTGIRYAQGEWCCFLDADDFLPENSLSTLFNAGGKGEIDLVIGGYEIWDQNDKVLYRIEDRILEEMNRDNAIALMYKSKYYSYLGYIWSKLFKTAIIHNNNICFNPKIIFNEDRLFVTQYIAVCKSILLFTEPAYYYIEHPGSAVSGRKKGFNDVFATDMDAMILMRETIVQSSPNNYKLATEGIAVSYWEIQHLMNVFHANSFKRVFSLHRKLMKHLSLKEYVRLIVHPFFQKVFKHLKHHTDTL